MSYRGRVPGNILYKTWVESTKRRPRLRRKDEAEHSREKNVFDCGIYLGIPFRMPAFAIFIYTKPNIRTKQFL